MKLNLLTLMIIAVFVIFFVWRTSNFPWTPYRIVGATIAVPSLLLLVVARLQLGRAFSIRPMASILVTTGLYSRFRNPIYVFSSIFLIGVCFLLGMPWLLLFLAIILPIQFFRGRKEAEVLEEKFGDEYRAYKQKTWF